VAPDDVGLSTEGDGRSNK